MTRKRFIKLLMGAGLQRDRAVRLAEAAKLLKVPYYDAMGAVAEVAARVLIKAMQEESTK